MRTFWQDVRYGFRMVARNPGFAVIVVGILAVGIAANTALFSVVNAVMLRPLPYKDSHELVWIRQPGIDRTEQFRHRPNFLYLREHNHVFESVAGYHGNRLYVRGIESPHQVVSCDVTANLFSLLGGQPIRGRGFGPEDEKPESPRVVVVSHALRNSLIPVVTVMGPIFALLVTGTFVTETIFGIPGMGRYFVTSITNRDYPVIMGFTLIIALVYMFVNLLVDLLYSWLNPQIQ